MASNRVRSGILSARRAARRAAWEGERLRWRLFHPVTLGARVILLRDDHVLLVEHTYRPGWFFPGGGIDKGETLEEAARREAREEAGATLRDLTLLGLYATFDDDKTDHLAIFVSRDFDWAPPAQGDEISRVEWFPLDALPPGLAPGAARRLQELQAGAPPGAGHW